MRQIIVPGPEDFFSEVTAALLQEAVEASGYVSELRASIEADEASRREADLAEFDAGQPTEAARLNRIDLLQAELKLCRKLEPFFKAQSQDAADAVSRMTSEMEDAKREVEQGLESIGFAKPISSHRVPGSFQPGWSAQHPRVLRLHHEINRLRGFGRDHAELNRKNVGEIEAQLRAIRDAAVA
ncbi:MAG: hypothetical protein KDA75_13200 [Planctomycetaceae bacterium]|nr:hypothetical protein [Planctomycetaceae bacterium]